MLNVVGGSSSVVLFGVVLAIILLLPKDSDCLKIEYYLSLSMSRLDCRHNLVRI